MTDSDSVDAGLKPKARNKLLQRETGKYRSLTLTSQKTWSRLSGGSRRFLYPFSENSKYNKIRLEKSAQLWPGANLNPQSNSGRRPLWGRLMCNMADYSWTMCLQKKAYYLFKPQRGDVEKRGSLKIEEWYVAVYSRLEQKKLAFLPKRLFILIRRSMLTHCQKGKTSALIQLGLVMLRAYSSIEGKHAKSA